MNNNEKNVKVEKLYNDDIERMNYGGHLKSELTPEEIAKYDAERDSFFDEIEQLQESE